MIEKIDNTRGKITSAMEAALRQLAIACFESGYGDMNWIEKLKNPKSGLMLNRIAGLNRADVNAIMLDELTILANKIHRDRDLIEVQTAKY